MSPSSQNLEITQSTTHVRGVVILFQFYYDSRPSGRDPSVVGVSTQPIDGSSGQ
jgi:hypothetical protein